MIIGAVNAALEAIIPLSVQEAAGTAHPMDAVIDTGFNGSLTLAPTLVAALGLSWLCRQQGQLADGSIQAFDVYTATVIWDGQPRTVEVEAADGDPLVGMELLEGHDLRIQVVPGGPVTVTALP
ncbi:MAG TPA: clan AA aspartic protease [Gemmataceae bacterium]|nr:clan AA aspartic protease [Gemmataceae bacterium]